MDVSRSPSQTPAGQHARGLQKSRRHLRVFVGLVALGGLLVIQRIGFSIRHVVPLVCCLVGLALIDRVCIPLMDWFKRREKQAAQGAEAEESVARLLERLSQDHAVLHGVPANYGDIDHLVFRRDGAVFCIETKSHRGKITELDGRLFRDEASLEKDFVWQTKTNCDWLEQVMKEKWHLSVKVHSAIVFTNAYVDIHRPVRTRLSVIPRSYLVKWMASIPGDSSVATTLWSQRQAILKDLAQGAR
jgi:hypothetical protein